MSTVAHTSRGALTPVPATHDGACLDAPILDGLWLQEGLVDAMHDGVPHAERIIAAAGAVESLEWELDRAQSALTEAIEQAASNGCPLEEIAESAGLTRADVATMLWAARSDRSHR
ncbi:MAG: hypothetical protein ACLGHS_08905 [Actinomycetes bacterium]